MKGKPVIYLGRMIDKANFRTNVYGVNGEKKLVESWAEYEACVQSGVWFSTREDAKESVAPVEEEVYTMTVDELPEQGHGKPEPKPKAKPKPKPSGKGSKLSEPPQKAEIIPDDDMGFEVTDDNK